MSPRHRLIGELGRAREGWKTATDDIVRLRVQVAALKRRVRLLREEFYAAKMVARAGATDVDALDRFVELLDLRTPLPAKRRR